MNNKYQPLKQCSCRMCTMCGKAYPNQKNHKLRIAKRKFRHESNQQLKNYILNPESDIDRIIVSVDLFS